MTFRRSIEDYKRNANSQRRFPGERRSHQGLFSGFDDRLVHVSPRRGIRDYSYPLCGLQGISSSRFGFDIDGELYWTDEATVHKQRYVDGSSLVETVYSLDDTRLVQRDLTTDRLHVTTFNLPEITSETAELVSFFEFAPENQEGRVGKLIHDDDDVIEVFHNREHDFVSVSTRIDRVVPQTPERLEDIVSADPERYPQSLESDDYEESRLTGSFCTFSPVTDGTIAVASLLTDIEERQREESIRAVVDAVSDEEATRLDREERRDRSNLVATDVDDNVAADLRVLQLLSAPSGARIAGPDFDPYYQYSGGYGYTWFRDDGEIAKFLLEADERLDLGLDEIHETSARFYLEAQLADGRWPHRVWPMNGRIAPGWANGHIEGKEQHYQADQTASVLVFLAEYLQQYKGQGSPEFEEALEEGLANGLDGLDRSLQPDGLPASCENAWENMDGRFTHTAAGFLHAYSMIAQLPLDRDLTTHAEKQANRVYDALDELWVPDGSFYGLRLVNGGLDERVDISTVALVDAHSSYAEIRDVDEDRKQRLSTHLDQVFSRLWKDTDEISGLYRFEEDDWRQGSQGSEKVWTVATGWGAYACEKAARFFTDSTSEPDFRELADRLYRAIDPGGPLSINEGYLPEQFFDTGEPDSATPLGWSHAIRLATYAYRNSEEN